MQKFLQKIFSFILAIIFLCQNTAFATDLSSKDKLAPRSPVNGEEFQEGFSRACDEAGMMGEGNCELPRRLTEYEKSSNRFFQDAVVDIQNRYKEALRSGKLNEAQQKSFLQINSGIIKIKKGISVSLDSVVKIFLFSAVVDTKNKYLFGRFGEIRGRNEIALADCFVHNTGMQQYFAQALFHEVCHEHFQLTERKTPAQAHMSAKELERILFPENYEGGRNRIAEAIRAERDRILHASTHAFEIEPLPARPSIPAFDVERVPSGSPDMRVTEAQYAGYLRRHSGGGVQAFLGHSHSLADVPVWNREMVDTFIKRFSRNGTDIDKKIEIIKEMEAWFQIQELHMPYPDAYAYVCSLTPRPEIDDTTVDAKIIGERKDLFGSIIRGPLRGESLSVIFDEENENVVLNGGNLAAEIYLDKMGIVRCKVSEKTGTSSVTPIDMNNDINVDRVYQAVMRDLVNPMANRGREQRQEYVLTSIRLSMHRFLTFRYRDGGNIEIFTADISRGQDNIFYQKMDASTVSAKRDLVCACVRSMAYNIAMRGFVRMAAVETPPSTGAPGPSAPPDNRPWANTSLPVKLNINVTEAVIGGHDDWVLDEELDANEVLRRVQDRLTKSDILKAFCSQLGSGFNPNSLNEQERRSLYRLFNMVELYFECAKTAEEAKAIIGVFIREGFMDKLLHSSSDGEFEAILQVAEYVSHSSAPNLDDAINDMALEAEDEAKRWLISKARNFSRSLFYTNNQMYQCLFLYCARERVLPYRMNLAELFYTNGNNKVYMKFSPNTRLYCQVKSVLLWQLVKHSKNYYLVWSAADNLSSLKRSGEAAPRECADIDVDSLKAYLEIKGRSLTMLGGAYRELWPEYLQFRADRVRRQARILARSIQRAERLPDPETRIPALESAFKEFSKYDIYDASHPFSVRYHLENFPSDYNEAMQRIALMLYGVNMQTVPAGYYINTSLGTDVSGDIRFAEIVAGEVVARQYIVPEKGDPFVQIYVNAGSDDTAYYFQETLMHVTRITYDASTGVVTDIEEGDINAKFCPVFLHDMYRIGREAHIHPTKLSNMIAVHERDHGVEASVRNRQVSEYMVRSGIRNHALIVRHLNQDTEKIWNGLHSKGIPRYESFGNLGEATIELKRRAISELKAVLKEAYFDPKEIHVQFRQWGNDKSHPIYKWAVAVAKEMLVRYPSNYISAYQYLFNQTPPTAREYPMVLPCYGKNLDRALGWSFNNVLRSQPRMTLPVTRDNRADLTSEDVRDVKCEASFDEGIGTLTINIPTSEAANDGVRKSGEILQSAARDILGSYASDNEMGRWLSDLLTEAKDGGFSEITFNNDLDTVADFNFKDRRVQFDTDTALLLPEDQARVLFALALVHELLHFNGADEEKALRDTLSFINLMSVEHRELLMKALGNEGIDKEGHFKNLINTANEELLRAIDDIQARMMLRGVERILRRHGVPYQVGEGASSDGVGKVSFEITSSGVRVVVGDMDLYRRLSEAV